MDDKDDGEAMRREERGENTIKSWFSDDDGDVDFVKCNFQRFGNYGFNSSGKCFSPLSLNLSEMNLTGIARVRIFIYLKYLDVTKNRLTLDALSVISGMDLVKIVADRNKITSAQLPTMKHLWYLSLKKNKIEYAETECQPHLKMLYLDENHISAVNLKEECLPRLRLLTLSHNSLRTLEGIQLPSLMYLFVASNGLKTLDGIEHLANLKKLHVRDNKIKKIKRAWFGLWQLKLEYINLRNNQIESSKELQKIEFLPRLTTIVLKGNPIAEEEDYRVSVVARLETVTRIDKAAVTAQEFKAATAMNGEFEGEEEGEGESDEDVTEEGGSEGEGEGRKSSKSSLYQGATPRPIIRDTDDDDTTSDEPESDDN